VPRTSIKSQALADFVAEWTEAHVESVAVDLEYLGMYFNGSLMLQGVGVVLVSPNGNRMRYVLHSNFEGATNNIADYEALLHGLRTAVTHGVRRLVALGDSKLVIRQVMKTSTCCDHKMEAYCAEVRKLEAKFDGLELCHIPQRDNEKADSLARIGSTRDMPPGGMFLDKLTRPKAWWEVETQPPLELSAFIITKAVGSNLN
jgi:ribonuclease HI